MFHSAQKTGETSSNESRHSCGSDQVCAHCVSAAQSECTPYSYGRDPHDHLTVGAGGEACFAGPDLTQDVQDGVAAVVVEDSPEPPNALIPPAVAAQAERIGA